MRGTGPTKSFDSPSSFQQYHRDMTAYEPGRSGEKSSAHLRFSIQTINDIQPACTSIYQNGRCFKTLDTQGKKGIASTSLQQAFQEFPRGLSSFLPACLLDSICLRFRAPSRPDLFH
jgi:hypothetical protein